MKKILKTVIISLLTMTLTFAFLGCGNNKSDSSNSDTSSNESETLKKIKERGYIIVAGTGSTPFTYLDKDTNEIKGIDGEITTAIAKALGIDEVRFLQSPFESLLLELGNGNCDLISSGMYITEERQKVALFSNVYYKEGEAILVRNDSPYKTLEELKDAVVGLEQGTGYIKVAEQYKSEGLIKNIQTFQTLDETIYGLASGKCQAVMADNVAIAYNLKNNPNSDDRIISPYEMKYSGIIGAAFSLDDKKFVEEWNEQLDKLKEDGTVEEICKKYGLTDEFLVEVQEGQTQNP